MIRCSPGDVVLVRFPFTDLTSSKKRPALILSPTEYGARHADVVILALTGRQQPDDELRLRQWEKAGLLKPTWLKPLIATVAGDVVERPLGRLADEDRSCVVNAVGYLIAPLFLKANDR